MRYINGAVDESAQSGRHVAAVGMIEQNPGDDGIQSSSTETR